jgi:arylsulfatase A-like enzyme
MKYSAYALLITLYYFFIMSKSKQIILKSLIIALFFGLSSCEANRQEKKKANRPNVVLILTDDQGFGDLSIMGNTNLSTPNIDAIAQNGAMFDRFYVSPVCSPTRAEILTGRHHVRGGVYSTSAGGERLDLDETTVAQLFQKAGYKTAAYGKWHNGMQYPYHPNARGFDEYYGFCSGHWGNYFSPPLEHNGQIVKGNGFMIDDFTDHAMQFIEENQDNPFFVYLPYNTPHSPMQVPDRFWNKFKDMDLKMMNRDIDRENILHTKAAMAMCENIDWNVGRIMDKLKMLNLEENTIILYLSDNGPNGWRWNDGMKGRKGSTDEGGVRSPLLVQWKGKIPEGKKVMQIASAIDLLPTLCDLTNIPAETPKIIDGKSLKPLLLEKAPDWPDRLVINHWRDRTSIRSQQYRLDFENKLFDMVDDPGQYKDISVEEPDIHNQMVLAKVAWEKEVLSELPLVDERTFPLGHPDTKYTQVPARDGKAHGNIKRSNRFPNCSFFTNWVDVEDKITWDVDVVEDGNFKVVIYYTCPENDIGSNFSVTLNDSKLNSQIMEAHDPPLFGMDEDRDKRIESYVKDFKPLELGVISLKKGIGTLILQANDIPGNQVMDFRLMMFERVD